VQLNQNQEKISLGALIDKFRISEHGVDCTGLNSGGWAYWAARLFKSIRLPVCAVLPSAREAEIFIEDLRFFLKNDSDSIIYYPPYNILPFNLEIDQAFIAAILTIIGYSINDTVIIFDRIREYMGLYPKKDLNTNINNALNSTLARTINTSGTTLVVLIIIFIFGGEIIRGFTFALLVGVAIGTYSSLFNASPIVYDLINKRGSKKIVENKSGKKKK